MSNRPATVTDVMSEPMTVPAERPVAEATRVMLEEGIGSLIITEGETPVGIITETDIVELVADRRYGDDVVVGDVMSTPLLSIAAETELEEAARRLKEHAIKKLPVMQDDRLVGIITTTDIAHLFPQYHPKSTSWVE